MFGHRVLAVVVAVAVVVAIVAAIVGPATSGLTLLGALVVAIVTASAADARQARQLEADTERQARVLEAERERHLDTLAHGRELADLEDLRGLLDDGAKILHRVYSGASSYVSACEAHGPDAAPVARARKDEFEGPVVELDGLETRFVVRLGHQAEVSRTFGEALSAALAVDAAVKAEPDAPDPRTAMHELAMAQDAFLTAAVELAGSRVMPVGNALGTAPPANAY